LNSGFGLLASADAVGAVEVDGAVVLPADWPPPPQAVKDAAKVVMESTAKDFFKMDKPPFFVF
jgi:hypothetical protein